MDWDWNTTGGITLGRLVLLLQTCPSLRQMALCLDTRGYTDVPDSHANPEWTLPPWANLSINVLDSVIEADSVPSLGRFFHDIAAYFGSRLHLNFWGGVSMMRHPDQQGFSERWDDVRTVVCGTLRRHIKVGDSIVQVVHV